MNRILGFLILFISSIPVMAQNEKEPIFMFAPLAEVSFNNAKDSPSFGGGFILGADGQPAIGIQILYLNQVKTSTLNKRIDALDTTFYLRVYLYQPKPQTRGLSTGLFAQLNFGSVIYFAEDDWSIPAVAGTMSVGLSVGWRFPIGDIFYIEPVVRGGYPFLFSGGVSVGFRL